MKRNFIKKIITLTIICITLLTTLPIGASAEWRKNSSDDSWSYDNVKNDWVYDKGNWYYLNADGKMMSNGWIQVNGKWYYLSQMGTRESNTTIFGYTVDSNGVWIGDNSKNTPINNDEIDNTNKPKDIKTIDDLEEYLNDNYSSLKTPIGTLKFSFNTMENDDKMFPYDFEIQTDWGDIEDSKYDLDDFDPSDLTDSIKISDDDKEKTKELLKEYQENVAKVAMKYFPEKKIKGGFYSGFYKYQYLRTGYESVQFYSWQNYDLDLSSYKYYTNQYNHSTLSDFQWNNTDDTYNLD